MLPPEPGPFDAWLQPLQDTSWASAISQGASLFPWLESIHVIGLVTVFGTIAVVDLRLLGWLSLHRNARVMIKELTPLTWIGFGIALVTGFLMFASNATKYAANPFFAIKMGLLLLAGINLALFHLRSFRHIADWGDHPNPPYGARAAGAVSLLVWTAIVVMGRWIGFYN